MTTAQRNAQKLQELAALVEALRNGVNGPQVDYTLKRIAEWSEKQLLARFIQIRRSTLDAAVHGNPKYREANMVIVLIYETVVTHLAPRDMKLEVYHNKFCNCKELLYRGECQDGRILYVNLDLIEDEGTIPAEELFSTAFWLNAIDDRELVWIAAKCQECSCEFRPEDGYVSDGPNLVYSYCAECYSD